MSRKWYSLFWVIEARFNHSHGEVFPAMYCRLQAITVTHAAKQAQCGLYTSIHAKINFLVGAFFLISVKHDIHRFEDMHCPFCDACVFTHALYASYSCSVCILNLFWQCPMSPWFGACVYPHHGVYV